MVIPDVRKWRRIQRPWSAWDEEKLRRNVGVYLHIPFCLHRCSYCDFLTYGDARPGGLTPPAYVDAMLEEISRRGEWAQRAYGAGGRLVDTVFFGGGTPTYLEPEVLSRLVKAVYRHFPMAASGIEFTVEANPDTLTEPYLHAMAEAGVNRLSVGVQSTQTKHLRRMQRTHRWRDIEPRLAWLAGGPIPRFSFDIIYGLPFMSPLDVKQTIHRLLQFSPRHISAYELIYEPGTPLHKWRTRFPGQPRDERDCLDQHRIIGRMLGDRGLYRYEISNYATPGEESRHNLRYWRGGDYIGLGIGAASRIGTDVVNNHRRFEQYRNELQRIGTAADPLSAGGQGGTEAPPADVFMRMRTRRGMELNGERLDPAWIARRWLRVREGRAEVTSRGLSYADTYHKRLA